MLRDPDRAGVALHRRPLVLSRDVNIALDDPDGIVPQNGCQCGKIDSLLGHARSEGMAEIVQNKVQPRFFTRAIVGPIKLDQVLPRSTG